MIERIDEMVGEIVSDVDLGNTIFAITADHITPVETGEHTKILFLSLYRDTASEQTW